MKKYSTIAKGLVSRCRSLAAYSDEDGFITRTFLSESFRGVHAELSATMNSAGMMVRVDAAGNLRGIYAGTLPEAPTLFIGSHLDTVPHAGPFDGMLGVLIGIALVQALKGRRLPFSIEIIGFSEEEGVRFGVPFIGSRALAGQVDSNLLALRDRQGISVSQAIVNFGLDPSHMEGARAQAESLGYLEFHIEQGTVLDSLKLPIAIVDSIRGRSCWDAIFTGLSGHAGTTPMNNRRDALAGTAEWINQVEGDARATPGLVASIGQVEVQPGAANVIPGICRSSLDVRHSEDAVRVAAGERYRRFAQEIAMRRNLTFEFNSRVEYAATPMDPSLVSLLGRAVDHSGAKRIFMSSGAGHDAMVVASAMPVAMMFIRCPHGISHHPQESVIEEDVSVAIKTGINFLEELAKSIDFHLPGQARLPAFSVSKLTDRGDSRRTGMIASRSAT